MMPSEPKRRFLVLGLPVISAKIGRHYEMQARMLGAGATVASGNWAGTSEGFVRRYDLRWIEAGVDHRRTLRRVYRELCSARPTHAELYLNSGCNKLELAYLMLLWMTRTPFVTWCRGGELDYWHESSWFRRFVVSLAVRTAGLVAYKESAMMSRLDALGVPLARRHFFYNCIPFNAAHPTPASERRNVLFANSWKVWRRPDVALGVAVRLAPRFPDVEFTIAGHRSWVQEPHSKSEFEKRLREAGLSDRVRLLPFVEDPGELMRGSGIFLLPSELVFPNYALLEAMERGLVPVVSAAPDADKIVTDGQEGFLVDGMDEEKFTDRVRSLLENGAMRERMAYAAREKIRCKFNLSTAMPELLKAFQRCVWKRRPGRDSFCLRDGELASSCLLNDE